MAQTFDGAVLSCATYSMTCKPDLAQLAVVQDSREVTYGGRPKTGGCGKSLLRARRAVVIHTDFGVAPYAAAVEERAGRLPGARLTVCPAPAIPIRRPG